jgi:hypothetical protein
VGEARADMASNISTQLKSIGFWLKVFQLVSHLLKRGLKATRG